MYKRQHAVLVGALLLLTAARLVVAATLPLAYDEAYYWTWSRHLAWGYPDHPPMIAAVIRLTTALVGNSPLGVRLGSVLFALGTSILLFLLGRQMFGPTTGIVVALAYQAIPVFALGAILAAPDAPMAFFWVLTLWFTWRAMTRDRVIDWFAGGVSLGLAIISKLPAILLGLSIAGFLLTSPHYRTWLLRKGPYCMVVGTVITALPLLWWNAAHGWLILMKARESVPWTVLSFPGLNALAFLGAQFVYYGPLTLPLLLVALRDSIKRPRRTDPRFALLAWAAVPLIGLTWIASFDGLPKPHWTAPGFLIALVPGAALWVGSLDHLARWRYGQVAFGLNCLIIAIFYGSFFLPASPGAVALRGWDQVATKLTPLIEQTPRSPGVFVLAIEYQTASEIAFQLQERYPITTVYGNTAFAVRNDPQMFIDWNAVFLKDPAEGIRIPLLHMFRSFEPLPPIDVTVNGRVVKRFFVYRGYGFRGFPPPSVQGE